MLARFFGSARTTVCALVVVCAACKLENPRFSGSQGQDLDEPTPHGDDDGGAVGDTDDEAVDTDATGIDPNFEQSKSTTASDEVSDAGGADEAEDGASTLATTESDASEAGESATERGESGEGDTGSESTANEAGSSELTSGTDSSSEATTESEVDSEGQDDADLEQTDSAGDPAEFCPDDDRLVACFRFAELGPQGLVDDGPRATHISDAKLAEPAPPYAEEEPWNFGLSTGVATRFVNLYHEWQAGPEISFEVWIARPEGQQYITYIVSRSNHMEISVDTDGHTRCRAGPGLSGGVTGLLSWSKPHHIRCSWDGTTLTMYADGSYIGHTTRAAFEVPERTILMLANTSTEGGSPLLADYYGLRVWSTATPPEDGHP